MVTHSLVDAGLFVAMKKLIILIVAEKLKILIYGLTLRLRMIMITSTDKSNDQNKYTSDVVQRVLIIG